MRALCLQRDDNPGEADPVAGYNGYQDNLAVDEDEFQQDGMRHDSFDQQPVSGNKWEDEDDEWDTQPRKQDGEPSF